MSTPAEQAGQGIAIQPTSNPLLEGSIRKSLASVTPQFMQTNVDVKDRIFTVEDPFFGEDIPKPEGDPFEALLKPLLERDSKQCDAWKDEVQNILIFAGLFSAVITAFIIESYQKLQADPNDQIVMLLAQISAQLASSPNNTTAPSVTSAGVPFTPSRSDIRVNIFWFISLVLSLTVALIGIIALQWLREHQRYDNTIEPIKAFGIFNARSEGLRRWYVPQIFALLPLLLQGALVLFFVGLIDFLFAIRTDVAIPVGVSLGIPIFFLVATTLLPTLQLYAMEFPHLLSVNYRVPTPCPYKSPQSLISRRVAILSQTFFRFCTYIFAAMYAPFVGTIRLFVTVEKPFYGKLAPFHGNIDDVFNFINTMLRRSAGDWMTLDIGWLRTRTSYAIIVRTPDNFREAHSMDFGLVLTSLAPKIYFYDCVQGMLLTAYSSNHNSLYHCGETLIGEQCSGWDRNVHDFGHIGDLEHQISLMRKRCMAVMAILTPENRLPTSYLQTRPGEMLPDGKVLQNAYRTALMDRTQPYGMESAKLRKLSQRSMESHMRFITAYLLGNTQQFLECTSTDVLPQRWMLWRASYYRREIELHCPTWMNDMSQQWTLVLTKIIQNSLEIRPSTFGAPHVCSSFPPCGGDVENDNVKGLMKYILLFQVGEDIKHTLQLLNQHCTSALNPIRDLPYVLIIACAYINGVAGAGCSEDVVEFDSLFETVSSICGHQTTSLIVDFYDADTRRWDGLESALKYIRDNQNQTVSAKHEHEPLDISDVPIDHQEIKAPDNV